MGTSHSRRTGRGPVPPRPRPRPGQQVCSRVAGNDARRSEEAADGDLDRTLWTAGARAALGSCDPRKRSSNNETGDEPKEGHVGDSSHLGITTPVAEATYPSATVTPQL